MLWRSVGRVGASGLLRCLSVSLHSGTRTATAARCPPFLSRCFSSSVAEDAQPPVKRWTLAVSPFTTVRAHLGCSISISPLDLHAFPEADRAFITVQGSETQVSLDQVQVRYDEESKDLLISAEKVHSGVSIEMSAPIKSNLLITTRGNGSVHVKNMECDICQVQTEEGNCLLHSVKGHQVEVQSRRGHISGVGTIHGNVDIRTRGDGAVDVKKLQGSRMNVSTERGSMKIKAIYAQSSELCSSSGKVELGHLHSHEVTQ
ncbi:protein FAM185A [Gouania willdenowi]|uniref:protein FAM185A n=1 Tax=Gouania willdenowi TaxID=441366 RepID=UPI001055A4CC|nr:protein FAM185A [Gouania willdenowi]